MTNRHTIIGMEINPKLVGVLFTERLENILRVFCFYTNGDTSQFELSADDNLDNLQHFLTEMDIEVTCSSFVLDEVVQERIYARSGEHCWLYTLLSAPGSRLPPFSADIAKVPWQPCWRSSEAEILEYGRSGDPVHCFAIRTEVSEGNVDRLIRQSKAFKNPVFIPQKAPRRWRHLNLGFALVSLGMLISLTLIFTLKLGSGKPPNSQSPAMRKVDAGAPDTGYDLLCNHHISGPYPAKSIIAMNAGGLLSAAAMCRAGKSAEWINVTNLLPVEVTK